LNAAQFSQTVIQNLHSMASILQIMAIAGGLGLFIMSLFEFHRYGQMRTFMSHQMSMARPLSIMLSGIMLIIMPTLITTFMLAFWGSASPMAYTSTSDSGWAPLMPMIIMFVRVIGVGAFMRGIFMVSRMGQHGGQQGGMSKALLHMFGGILCINVVATEQLLHAILPI